MNARRKHLIKKVIDAFILLNGSNEDLKFKNFKKHLEALTEEEIEQELTALERKNNEQL